MVCEESFISCYIGSKVLGLNIPTGWWLKMYYLVRMNHSSDSERAKRALVKESSIIPNLGVNLSSPY